MEREGEGERDRENESFDSAGSMTRAYAEFYPNIAQLHEKRAARAAVAGTDRDGTTAASASGGS